VGGHNEKEQATEVTCSLGFRGTGGDGTSETGSRDLRGEEIFPRRMWRSVCRSPAHLST